MDTVQITWTGRAVGEYVVDELVCSGPFSWIYKAGHVTRDGESLAVKISKPYDMAGRVGEEVVYPTQALAEGVGAVASLTPDAAQLLLLQADKLKTKSEKLVAVRDVTFENDFCILPMEWLEGKTLRELMKAGLLSVSLVLELVQSLETLAADERFRHHGDLKPDNIMVTPSGIKLLDPGYFGPLDCQEGACDGCAVTSPSYYPLLIPDDLLALGIVCWEASLRQHPLDGVTDSRKLDLSGVGEELLTFVRTRELTGNHFLTPILQAMRPSAVRADMPAELEEFLLKAMRLQVRSDGKMDLAKGFSGFGEMIASLQSLIENNVHHF